MFTCWRQCLVGLINEYQWVTDWRLNGCTTECRMTERLTDWTSLFWAISRFFANFVLLLASTSVIKLLLWIIFSRGRFRAISRASPFFLLRRRFFVEYFLGWYHRIWTNDSDLTITSNNFKSICAQIGSTVHLAAFFQFPGQPCTHQAEPQNLSDLDTSRCCKMWIGYPVVRSKLRS